MPENMTLEEAQEKIIALREANDQLKTENETLSQNNADLTAQLDDSRKRCQRYFNKLEQQFLPTEDKNDDEPEVPSCEEFAKSLTNII